MSSVISKKSKIVKLKPGEDGSWEPLPRKFFEDSAVQVAPRLLGHYLLRQTPSGYAGGIIVEVEAYLIDDPACHAFRGITPRTAVMFGPPAHVSAHDSAHRQVPAASQNPVDAQSPMHGVPASAGG